MGGQRASEQLQKWHLNLQPQFERLRAQQAKGMVFALEHGLSDNDIQELKQDVRRSASDPEACKRYWLPWVVYATEFGYRYSGLEYWSTFQAETPNWYASSDNQWLREIFRKFSRRFSGAEPTGLWASHFSIISWPITHAILPQDLQVDLARSVYDVGRYLSTELLEDRKALGELIAMRSHRAKKRFRTFASQHELVGTITSALLTQEASGEDLIFPATLERVTKDLQRTKDAREWLRNARGRVRTTSLQKGLRPDRWGLSSSGHMRPEITREDVLLETGQDLSLRLSVRPAATAWELWLAVPAMRSLAQTSPETDAILRESRVFVEGFEGTPRPRGSLMDGFSVELTHWPTKDKPLLRAERSTPVIDYLLSSEAVLPSEELLVFKLKGDREGALLTSPVVRQRRSYLVLSKQPLDWDQLKQVPLACTGLIAYYLEVPAQLSGREIQRLRAVGLKDVLDVTISPAGKVPAGWDTEADSVWLAGEHPRFAVRCGFDADLSFRIASQALQVQVPAGETTLVELPVLLTGEHSFEVKVASEEVGVMTFPVNLLTREPRPQVAEFSTSLRLRSDPPSPTMEELWEGRASIQIAGPDERGVLVEFNLVTPNETVRRTYEALLPIDAQAWADLLGRFRTSEKVSDVYDDAKEISILFSAGLVGRVELECFPEPSSLRWRVKRQGGSQVLRLIDHAGVSPVRVMHCKFDRPDEYREETLDEKMSLHDPPDGLHLAFSNASQTGVVSAPSHLTSLTELRMTPYLSREPRNPTKRVPRLLTHLSRWAGANVPGSALAQTWRRNVLSVLEDDVFRTLCGSDWAQRAPSEPWSFTTSQLSLLSIEITGRDSDLSRKMLSQYRSLLASPLTDRVEQFGRLTGCRRTPPTLLLEQFNEATDLDDFWLSEFILRLASHPESILVWAGRLAPWGIQQCLDSRQTVRAARFLVHALDCMEMSEDTALFLQHAPWGWE